MTRRGALQRFGLITTNSIRQAFNRHVIENAMALPKAGAVPPSPSGRRVGDEGTAKRQTPSHHEPSSDAARHLLPKGEGKEQPLWLVFAIPDHPWVDVADGAAVRIAMTVASVGRNTALLREVIDEQDGEDEVAVILRDKRGAIFANLKVGADVAGAKSLRANNGMYADLALEHHALKDVISRKL